MMPGGSAEAGETNVETQCIKCGHIAEVPEDPLAECPKCGVIYARARAGSVRKGRPPARPTWKPVVLGVFAVLVIFGVKLSVERYADAAMVQTSDDHLRKLSAQRKEDLDKRVAAAKARIEVFREEARLLDALIARWTDASTLAGSTSRIALSGPVQQMQTLVREIDALRWKSCMEQVRTSYLTSMKFEVEGFLQFMMGQAGEEAASSNFGVAEFGYGAAKEVRATCERSMAADEKLVNVFGGD